MKKDKGCYQCKWSGRRLIEFSISGPEPFVRELQSVSIEGDAAALSALRLLRACGGNAESVIEGFNTAKRMIEGRFRQYTSFLSQTPWNLVSLLEYLLPCKNELGAVSRSRARAVKILEDFDAGRLGNVGDVGKSFLGFRSKHRTSLERWGRGMDLYMNQQLFRELVGYATSLLVMQRLEAKHHLIHVACLVLAFFSLTCFHVFNV